MIRRIIRMKTRRIRFIQISFLLLALGLSSCSKISDLKSAKKYIVGTWIAEQTVDDTLLFWRVIFLEDGSSQVAGISLDNFRKTGWYNSELLWRGPWDAKKTKFTDTGEEYFMAVALFIDDNGTDRPWEFHLIEKNLVVMSGNKAIYFEKQE